MSLRRAWVWCGVGVLAVALTVAFADPFGALNQATYLLDPLRRAMPELYRHDWFVADTPPYLPVFGGIAAWLFRIDPEGPAAVLGAHLAVMLATYAAMHWLTTALGRDLRVLAIVAAITAVTMGRTLGGNYLVTGYFQPSSIATAGWVLAMAALVHRRYALCGVTLALAGLVHVNFLVLGFGVFLLAGLAALVGRDATWKQLAWLVVPQLLVLAYFASDLLAASGPSAQAVRILLEFHAPGHYAAGRLARNLPPLVAWQLAAFAVLPMLAPVAREARMLWRFSLVVFAVTVVTTAVIAIPALAQLTQVRWSRIAPFGQLACQVLVVAALVRHAGTPVVSVARRVAVTAATALAIVLTARMLRASPVLACAAIAAVVAVAWLPARAARSIATLAAALVVVVALWCSPRAAGWTTVPAGGDDERALASWVRRETPTDAVFVAPPGMMRFRLLARRAVVVDTKSPPLQPALLVQWYRRLCDSVEVADAPTHEWVEQHYRELTAAQLGRVAQRFGAAYIVVEAGAQLPGPPVYANAEYAVYRVPLG